MPRGGVASLLETSFPARGWSGCARAHAVAERARTYAPTTVLPRPAGAAARHAPRSRTAGRRRRDRARTGLIERQAGVRRGARARPWHGPVSV